MASVLVSIGVERNEPTKVLKGVEVDGISGLVYGLDYIKFQTFNRFL